MHNEVKVVFYPDKCVFQDLKTDRILGIGKAMGKLYIIDKNCFEKVDNTKDVIGEKDSSSEPFYRKE